MTRSLPRPQARLVKHRSQCHGEVMRERLRVAVVYGGRSGEHEVSLRSAAAVIAHLDVQRYEVVPVAIDKEGRWRTGPDSLDVLERAQRDLAPLPPHGSDVTLVPPPTCGVKPANLGSAVGITKVKQAAALADAVAEAGAYDAKVVIEAAVRAREFECAVLGNEEPEASVIGELVPSREFYDYADKYVDQGARVLIPAPLPETTAAAMRALALRVFRAVDCTGLARVDF